MIKHYLNIHKPRSSLMALSINTSSSPETEKKSTINNIAWITFRGITVTLLSLLLPLSFLVIARISTINYLTSTNYKIDYTFSDFPYSLLFSSDSSKRCHPPLLISIHLLICLVSISSLLNALGSSKTKPPITKPYLHTSWALLFTLQFLVTLGIEGTLKAGVRKYDFDLEKSILSSCRVMMFFLGLHETMLFWGGKVVKPVVDDTMFGGRAFHNSEGWLEKAAMGLSYAGLWWWRLRGELNALVAVPEMRMEMMMRVGVWDFMGWLVYHLMVSVGIVRVIKGIYRFGFMCVVNRRERGRRVYCNKLHEDRV